MSIFNISAVKDINQSKETWRIEVRIIRLWATYFQKTPGRQSNIEFVVEDDKAGQIQVSVPFFLIEKFQARLIEGSFHRMNNFEILDNDYIRATEHPYKLLFNNSTGCRPIDKPLLIPRYGFRFVEINDIKSGVIDEKLLVDVLAELIECEKLNDSDRSKIRTTAILRDDLGEYINCTFWSPFAEEVVNRWTTAIERPQGPIVLILKYAMIKEYKVYGRSIQNSKYASLLLFDDNIPEIAEFKSRLNADDSIQRSFTKVSSSSNNIIDDFSQRLQLLEIKQLDNVTKEGFFYVHGKVLNIATAYNWFYIGCKAHNIKIDVSAGRTCTKCGVELETEVRYKVTVRVKDESGVCYVVLFDDHVVPIIKKSASELKHALELEEELDSFPDELDQLIGKSCVFKVEVQKFNINQRTRTYTVKSLSEDPDVISKIIKGKGIVEAGKNLMGAFDESQLSSVNEVSVQEEAATPSQKRVIADCIDLESVDYQQSVTSKIMKIKEEQL